MLEDAPENIGLPRNCMEVGKAVFFKKKSKNRRVEKSFKMQLCSKEGWLFGGVLYYFEKSMFMPIKSQHNLYSALLDVA